MIPDLAFIGGGNMASAIISGLRTLAQPPQMFVAEVVDALREKHRAQGLRVSAQAQDAAQAARVILLAVKPQGISAVLAALAPRVGPEHLIISILAGVTTARLAAGLPSGVRIIRCMPNTPMAIGQGMAAICAGPLATSQDLDLAEAIFAPAARVLRTQESRMDAITAVSGSGPAYLFHFCEAFQAAAQQLGFTAEEAALLVGQTVSGSTAYLLSQAGFPAARLREQVTSPGGTTAAALRVFAEGNFSGLFARALAAAEQRGRELAQA